MEDAFPILAIFLGMASVVSLPLSVILGLPLLAWNLRAFIRLKEREVELQRLETSFRLTRSAQGLLPEYIDTTDPSAVLAWARVETELRSMS